MIAAIEAYRAGLYARAQWLPNLLAGVIVGVVALPLAMAFAIASGARPEQGLYTAIIGGGLVTLFGGSRLQIAGPTGAFVAILAGVTVRYGIAGLQLATLMAGALLLLMGLLRLGGVMRFISVPVICGFTAGIGVIIFVGQWASFLGVPAARAGPFYQQLWQLLGSLPQTQGPTLALALLSLVLVLLAPGVPGLRRVPGPLVALLLVTVLQAVLQLPGVATIGSAFGGIPSGLPHWQWPQLSMSQVLALTGPAVTIALLGGIESLLSATVADGMAGTRHDSNQELIGQGIANLIVPLFGGFAATGAIARTATNIRNGATSPLAGIVHALTLVIVLLLLAPLAASIPLATLAAILFVVAWNMSEPQRFVYLLRASPPADKAILLVTFVLTIFTDLVIAVNVGVGLSILQFLRRMAASAEAQPANELALRDELSALGCAPLPANTVVYEMSGPLFFAAVDNFERALLHTHTEPACLVLRLRHVPFIDMTGLQALSGVVHSLQRRGVQVVLCEANERVLTKLQQAGVLALPGLRYAPDLLRALAASPT